MANAKEPLFSDRRKGGGDPKEAAPARNVEDPKKKPESSGPVSEAGHGEKHRQQREAMAKAHEKERMDLHGSHREDHRKMHARHETQHKQLAAQQLQEANAAPAAA